MPINKYTQQADWGSEKKLMLSELIKIRKESCCFDGGKMSKNSSRVTNTFNSLIMNSS